MIFLDQLGFTSGTREGFNPSPTKHLVSKHQTKAWALLVRREDGIWGIAIGLFCMLSYTSIFSVQSAVHLSIDLSACLLVCQLLLEIVCPLDYSHQSVCLPIHLFMCLHLSFGLSINKSINQFVCLVNMSIYPCPSIHLEFISTTAFLSLPHLSHI